MRTWLQHPDEDTLEAYALHRTGEADMAPLEEHLLVCEPCQGRLQQIDEFILAFRTAGVMEAPEPSVWEHFRSSITRSITAAAAAVSGWLTPSYIHAATRLAMAGAVAMLCVAIYVERPRSVDGPPVGVTLQALRGGGPGFAATAPSRRPLALDISVPDIAACDACRVDLVSEKGRTAWSGTASIADGRMKVTAPVTLGPGLYWVRLYTGAPAAGAAPAREFGLRLE